MNSNLEKLINLIKTEELKPTSSERLLSIVSQIEQEVLAEQQAHKEEITTYNDIIINLQNTIQEQQNNISPIEDVLIKEKLRFMEYFSGTTMKWLNMSSHRCNLWLG